MIRTYLDSCVLIGYSRGTPNLAAHVQELLDDPKREFVSSAILELEVLPQPERHKRVDELIIYKNYFDQAKFQSPIDDALLRRAVQRMIKLPGLSVIDSLHLEAAISAGAQEFITDEKHTKPFFAETDIIVTRIRL